MRGMPEIIADLKTMIPALSPNERTEMSRRVDKLSKFIDADIHKLAHNATEALTPSCCEIWEAILERRLAWVSELEQVKALLQG
jgi:ubiquinone biosynthesis protein UbiJ